MSERNEQIIKMMDYLGVDKFYVNDPITLFWFSRETMSVEGMRPNSLYPKERMEERAYEKMIEACREKAVKHWADIALANNNLFWCMHEQ